MGFGFESLRRRSAANRSVLADVLGDPQLGLRQLTVPLYANGFHRPDLRATIPYRPTILSLIPKRSRGADELRCEGLVSFG